MLLALRDETGTLESHATMHSYALGGAILAELLLAGRIEVESGKKRLVNLICNDSPGNAVLDDALALIAIAKRRRKAEHWVSKFAHISRLRHRIAVELARKGILRDDEKTVLLLFKRKVYPTLNPTPERRLLEKLRLAITEEGRRIAPETGILLALAHGTGLLKAHFDRALLKKNKKRLDRLTDGELVGGVARDAVAAANAAIVAATTAAATTVIITS